MFANKHAGGSSASLRMLVGIFDLPMPVSKNVYTMHIQVIAMQSKLQAKETLTQARKEVYIVWFRE